MFRSLDKLQTGKSPPIQETIPQTPGYIHSYTTLQTDSTKKYETYIRPEKPALNVPKYTFYTKHQETPALQQSLAMSEIKDNTLYKSIIQPPIIKHEPVNYTKYTILSSKQYMPSILQDGNLSKPVALQEHQTSDEPLKITSTDVTSQALTLQGPLKLYSFCPELSDTAKGPFALECLQELFVQLGGSIYNPKYPNEMNKIVYDEHVWGDVRRLMKHKTIQMNTLQPMREYKGMEVLWFNVGTNVYMDRLTEFKNPTLSITSELPYHLEYVTFINIRSPNNMTVRLRMNSAKLFTNEMAPSFETFILKKGSNRIYAVWEGKTKNFFQLEYSENGHFKFVPKEWITLCQEPNAPLFSWEGKLSPHGPVFEEYRMPKRMALIHSPSVKIVETDSEFPILLQLRSGAHCGFSVTQQNISMNSWRSITCCFLSASGQGILYTFGPLTVNIIGKHVNIQWNSPTLVMKHTFEHVLSLDTATPYLLCVGMKSDLETIDPNRILIAVGSFSDWNAGRVSLEIKPSEFSKKAEKLNGIRDLKESDIQLGHQSMTHITKNFSPLYNTSDSAQLCIGNATHAANAAIIRLRVFDYELETIDVIRESRNSWERI